MVLLQVLEVREGAEVSGWLSRPFYAFLSRQMELAYADLNRNHRNAWGGVEKPKVACTAMLTLPLSTLWLSALEFLIP